MISSIRTVCEVHGPYKTLRTETIVSRSVTVRVYWTTLALGADQGGSIRNPSGRCGIVGLKPTLGLVPYTGIFPMEFSLDHVGPMARTAYDVALLLEVC